MLRQDKVEDAMAMPAETDTTSPKYLRDKYAIVGVGETEYMRGSGVTTRALGSRAVRNAIEDAGLKASDVDGMLSYQGADSTFSISTWTCSAAVPRPRRWSAWRWA
jgi:hypothetical protein